MKSASCLFLAVFLVVSGFAAIQPEDERTPFTAKELAQGYTDQVILARPLPTRDAEAEIEEARQGLRVRDKFDRLRGLRILEVGASETAAAAIARLRATGLYEFVEPDYIRQVAVEPNDPRFGDGSLWALKNTGQSNGIANADIKATAAWDIIREAPNVVVAVIDSGVNLSHQDIAANLWVNPSPTFNDINGARFIGGLPSGNPTDDNGHGTHVAGTIGAVGNNNLAIAGVAWSVRIMAVKVLRADGTGTTSDIVSGINYAVQRGAHIINASFGAISDSGFSNSELAAITAARNAGILLVAAAGNSAANMDVSRFYPASHALDNIVTVGNSTRRDELALSSNYGAAVDLFAPGSEIVSLDYASTTGTTTKTGTSMAAPHVAGALALLKARFPADNYRQLINRLLRGVDPGERFGGKSHTGGRLNLLAALQTQANTPFNDDFAARPRFTSDNLSLRGSNAGATAETGEPSHADAPATASLWWQWTAPATGLVSIDTSGSGYDTVLAVYTGSAANALTPVASNDNDASFVTSRLTFNAQAGVTYQIAVDGKNGASGLTLLKLGTTPANDLFASPVTLAGQSTRTTGTNAHCSREADEPRILNNAGGTSLWYRWTAPRNGRFQVAVASVDFDPLLAVYTGSALNALALVDANDDAGPSFEHTGSLCTINATAGTTYLITLDSVNAATVGQFTLTITDSLWQSSVDDAITGAPAVATNGTIYFGSTDGYLYAFNPDGTFKWDYLTNGSIDTCSPAVAEDGTVYVGSNSGTVFALNPSGGLKWTSPFGSAAPVANSPAIGLDGTVYVKAGNGLLYALNPANGLPKWQRNVNATQSYASPSVAPDGTVYQGSEDGKLYAFNPDGSPKWTFSDAESSDIYTVAAIDATGNLYFSVLNTGRLLSVTPGGTLRWVYRDAALGSSSSPALSPDGSTVYFGGYDKKLHAVNTATGSGRWTCLLGDEVRASSPAVDANGVIYIGCYDGKLYAINPDGSLKRTYDTGDWIRSCPAIFGTTLYVGSNDGKLYAFDIGAGPANGPWPQYRHNPRRTGRASAQSLTITAPPQSQTALIGQPLTLSVTAVGDGPLTYQWIKDGTAIAGATSAIYTVASVSVATAGSYSVVVSGAPGTITSPAATIAIAGAVPGRLVNLSVRTTAGTGDQTLTVGFVVGPGSAKPLLIRGVGPTLANAPFNVGGTLGDPRLQLYRQSTKLDENEDWGGSNSLATLFASVGAFDLPAASKDAALTASLAAANYTVQISGANNTTGIVLAEVYDRDPTDNPPAGISRLVNLSARAQVGTGDGILVAGFAISGNVPKRLLVRGVGPTLGRAPFNVGGTLADPKLEIYREQAKVDENDDWGGGATLTAAFDQVGAFRFFEASSFDSALLITLAPGTYTAQVRGINNTTGVALIEVYEVP